LQTELLEEKLQLLQQEEGIYQKQEFEQKEKEGD